MGCIRNLFFHKQLEQCSINKDKKDRLHAIDQNLGGEKESHFMPGCNEMTESLDEGLMRTILQVTDPSLHMGHCNLIGKVLPLIVIQKQTSWSGTCLKVKFGSKVISGEPLLGMPHMLVLHVVLKGGKWQRRAATCHTLYRKESKNTNQAPSALVTWKN